MHNREPGYSGVQFSVIIPAYNAEKTIRRAILSCLSQTYPPHEIIVVNDGSRDGTAAAVREAGAQVIYIELDQNTGPAYTRNKGLDQATGNYIAFLDADDSWHKDKLQIINELLTGHPERKFIFHPFTLSEPGNVANLNQAPLQVFPFRSMLWRNPIATPCVVMINEPELRFEQKMRYMEDYDLWLRIARRYQIYYLPIPLTRLGRPVRSEGGLSSNHWQMRKGELLAYTRFTVRHPAYLPILPFLTVFSLLKHVIKAIRGRTSSVL